MPSKQEKEAQELADSLGKVGKQFANLMRMAKMEAASTNQTLQDSQKVVRDKFKTLADTLKMTKQQNEFQKAAADIGKKILEAEKKGQTYNKNILTLQQKQLNVMGKIDDVASDLTEQFGMQASAIKNGVKQARLLLNPIVALGGALALSIKRFFELEKLGKGTARESGLLAMNTEEFSNKIADVQPELIAFGASIEDISKASAAVADNFGVLTAETADIVSQSVKVGAAFGVQADTMVNVVSEARLLGATMEDINMFTDEVIGSGVQVNKVFEDLKGISGDTAMIFAGNTDQIMSQVLEARKLGLNLNDIANAQSATAGFQDMFTKGMKATVLFGRQINLTEATRLRRNKDFTGAREEELAQLLGTRDASEQVLELQNMLPEQAKLFAEITGRSGDQTIKDLNRQLLLQGKLTGDAKRIAESEMDREQLLQRQLNLQDKLSAVFSKLAVKIGEQLLPFITKFADKLENLLDDPAKLNKLIDNVVSGLKTALGVLITIKGLKFAGSLASLFGGVSQGPAGIGMFEGLMGKGTAVGGRFKAGGGRFAAGTFARGAGASALRVLGPAAAAISLGADVFKAATTKDAKERRRATGGAAGAVIGGAIGAIGGPAGIAAGAFIGKFAGQAISNYFVSEEEKLGDLAARSSSIIESQLALKVSQRQTQITKSLADAMSEAVKGGTFDQMVKNLSTSLDKTAGDTESLLAGMGITDANFKDKLTGNIESFAKKLTEASGVIGEYTTNLNNQLNAEYKKAGVDKLEAQQKQMMAFKDIFKGDAGQDILMKTFARKFLSEEQFAGLGDTATMSGKDIGEKISALYSNNAFGTQTEATSSMERVLREIFTENMGGMEGLKKAFGSQAAVDKMFQDLAKNTMQRHLFESFAEDFQEDITEAVDMGVSKANVAIGVEKLRAAENVMNANDFTIRSNPADTLMVQGGTQIGNDVVEKLDQVITAINNMGGDIIMDGKKVGRQIARGQQ